MRAIWAVIIVAVALVAASPAGANCKCRARGVIATEGQTLCIRTPEGTRLARCDKVSNVASWTFLEGPCPQAASRIEPGLSRAPSFRPELDGAAVRVPNAEERHPGKSG